MEMEDFERLALHAEREALGFGLEYIYWRFGAKIGASGGRAEVIAWLTDRFMMLDRDKSLYQHCGIKVERDGGGRAIPDAMWAPRGSLAAQPVWNNPESVLMVVEVTSFESQTDRRSRIQKPVAYAETGIPIYLLIDRESRECVVHSGIEDDAYTTTVRRKFGRQLELPDPVGVVLETDELKELVG